MFWNVDNCHNVDGDLVEENGVEEGIVLVEVNVSLAVIVGDTVKAFCVFWDEL